MNRGARFATKQLPEGLLAARITFDTVYGISARPNIADYIQQIEGRASVAAARVREAEIPTVTCEDPWSRNS